MNYLESIVYIESLSPTTHKPCLERVAAFLDEAGKPQDRFPSIHVAGTNGKGSTVAILDGVFRAGGLRTGRYTGPHLLRWNERFHVDGSAIEDEEFAELATRIREMSEDFGRRHPEFGELTWFEFLTAMAFFWFAGRGVDIAVVEVGLGGRWDATNVIARPLASVVTNVELDHTHILGGTVEQIACEKAGIIKPGCPVVTAADGAALRVVSQRAQAVGSDLFICVPPHAISMQRDATSRRLDAAPFDPESLGQLTQCLALHGKHQRMNALAATAALAASGAGSLVHGQLADVVRSAFGSVYWPGRMQLVPAYNLVLDGAHNPAGARALRAALDELFPGRPILFVLGCFQNKDVETMIAELIRRGDRVCAGEAESRRAVYASHQLIELARSRGAEGLDCGTVSGALSEALARRDGDEIVVATGSFATVKESMLYLGWRRVEDGRAAACVGAPPVLTAV